MIAAVVIEITLDFVIAISFSRGSVLVDSSAVVSCSEEVRRFSFLKLLDFSKRLVRLESDLFFVRCEVIASFEVCRLSEPDADVVVESAVFRLSRLTFDGSLFKLGLSAVRFVEGVRLMLEGFLFNASVVFMFDGVFFRLLVVSFFGGFGLVLVLVVGVGLIALLLLLFGVFRIEDRS